MEPEALPSREVWKGDFVKRVRRGGTKKKDGCRSEKFPRGALLLEVLVAATVLSIGILACLNIFSAAIYTSTRSSDRNVVGSLMDQAFFDWFVDPTSVGLETGSQTLPVEGDEAFKVRLDVRLLNPEESEAAEQGSQSKQTLKDTQSAAAAGRIVKVLVSVPVEFFETKFVAERSQGAGSYEFNQVLYRYGKKARKR